MTKYQVTFTNKFKRQRKRLKARGYDLALLDQVVEILAKGEQLDERYQDHGLTGNWKGHRDCHILPDWILIYRIDDDVLILELTETGTHSDLF